MEIINQATWGQEEGLCYIKVPAKIPSEYQQL